MERQRCKLFAPATKERITAADYEPSHSALSNNACEYRLEVGFGASVQDMEPRPKGVGRRLRSVAISCATTLGVLFANARASPLHIIPGPWVGRYYVCVSGRMLSTVIRKIGQLAKSKMQTIIDPIVRSRSRIGISQERQGVLAAMKKSSVSKEKSNEHALDQR